MVKTKRLKKKYQLRIVFALSLLFIVLIAGILLIRMLHPVHRTIVAYQYLHHYFSEFKAASKAPIQKPATLGKIVNPPTPHPDVKVEFEFYKTLANMHIQVPMPPNAHHSPVKQQGAQTKAKNQLLEPEELENDVLKHIK